MKKKTLKPLNSAEKKMYASFELGLARLASAQMMFDNVKNQCDWNGVDSKFGDMLRARAVIAYDKIEEVMEDL